MHGSRSFRRLQLFEKENLQFQYFLTGHACLRDCSLSRFLNFCFFSYYSPIGITTSYRIVSYIVDLKWQNRLKVETENPKLKVQMQSITDDDVRKRLLEKPRFELAVTGVFILGRCYLSVCL